MKKRICAVLSLVFILCSILAIPALTLEVDPEEPVEPIDPEAPYVNIDYYNCGCSIDSNGKALCSSFASTRNATYMIYISITLQRYKDGYWQTYAGPWYGSGTHYAGAYKYYYVVSGYYYRTASSVTVQTSDGYYVESSYLNSPARYY